MDLRVAGHEVVLSLHRTYVSDDDVHVLQSVAKYKPLVDYLTKLHTEDFKLSNIVIRNVVLIAHRIGSITVDMLFSGANRETISQTVVLTDEVQSLLLPVVTSGDEKYAVLVESARLGLCGASVPELFIGSQGKAGSFSGPHVQLLTNNGFTFEGIANLGPAELNVGQDGQAPLRFSVVNKTMDAAALEKLKGSATEDAKLIVVPLLDVVRNQIGDLKTLTAVSLVLASY